MNEQMNSFIEIVSEVGLEELEAKVYVSSFLKGLAPASEIARQARLNRVTTYEVLKRLVKRGLASVTEQNGIKQFSVLGPDRLFQRAKLKLEEFQSQLKEFLSFRRTSGKQPKVSYYEGLEGLKEVYEDFISHPNTEVRLIANPQVLYDHFGMKYLNRFYQRRQKVGVKVRALVPNTPDGVRAQKEDQKANRKTKMFPVSSYKIPNEIISYDDKVALLSFSDKVAVVIQNKEIAESMRTLWQMAWDRF